MTTLDQFAARPAPRLDLRAAAMGVTTILLLGLGAIALAAPPAQPALDWHGNAAVSAPR